MQTRCVLFRASLPWAALCLLSFATATARAQTRFDDITVTVQPQPAPEGTAVMVRGGGYYEFRIVVGNLSPKVDHRVRLVYPSEPYSYGDCVTRNSRTVRIAHGATAIVSIFQPSLRDNFDRRLAVEIDGKRQETRILLQLPMNFELPGYFPGSRLPLIVLASRGIPQELKDAVRAAHSGASSGGREEVSILRSELAAGEWSPNWLGYTCYDAVMLTDQEAASLPADVLQALRRYAESGGMVLVQANASDASASVPAALRTVGEEPDETGAYHVGFGLVRVGPQAPPWPDEFWISRPREPMSPYDASLRVVSSSDVPVRGILVLVITFAIGIGPVNVWLLSRHQRKMWLWWIIPLVSTTTCLLVFVYSLFSEGISGRGRSLLITLLDENVHRATTVGYLAYYCPLTPSGGLHFSYDTMVTPLQQNTNSMSFENHRSRTLDWTNDQHLDSGWIMSRVPVDFAIRMNEIRRERLPIRKAADGTVTVVNGLGADIDSLFYVDEAGTTHVATDLPAGKERTLERKNTPPATAPRGKSLRTIYERSWNVSFKEVQTHPESFVAPGCYLAVVKKSPFLANPLPSATSLGDSALIYGVSETTDNGR